MYFVEELCVKFKDFLIDEVIGKGMMDFILYDL